MTDPPPPAARGARVDAHHRLAERLARASDEELIDAVSRSGAVVAGHACVRLAGSDTPAFAKLLPLSDLELDPRHRESTANFFGLPTYFQYRIGSLGFGAWRELEAQRAASAWVLSGESAHFPLLHHWRVLPLRCGARMPFDLDKWGDSPAIQDRFASITQATFSLVLFIEHIPQTLSAWFAEELSRTSEPLAAVGKLEATLAEQLEFIHSRGALHMDAHFDNLLVDRGRVYWTDFGLTLSRDFELGADERRFFGNHGEFDQCTIITSLLHAVVTHYVAVDDWRSVLRQLSRGRQDAALASIPADVRDYLVRRAPIALEIGDFYARLLNDLTTRFPAERFREQLTSTR